MCLYIIGLANGKRFEVLWHVQLLAMNPLLNCSLSYDKFSILLLISAQLTVKTCLLAPMHHLGTIVLTITSILLLLAWSK